MIGGARRRDDRQLLAGSVRTAASHIHRSIELATSECLTTSPLATGGSLALDLVPGRTYEIPVTANGALAL